VSIRAAFLALVLISPASAQSRPEQPGPAPGGGMSELCDADEPLEVRIGACSTVIETSHLPAERMAEIHTLRGHAYYQIGAFKPAFEDYSKAVQLMPNRADYHRNVGSARANLVERQGPSTVENLENSIADFNRALKLAPRDAETISRRGVAYMSLGDTARGLADLTQAIELDPDSPRLRTTRGYAHLNRGACSRAIEDFDEALRLGPTYLSALFGRGYCHDRLQNYDQALADFDEIIRQNPAVANAYNNRGMLRAKRGNVDGAMEDFSIAITLEPNLAGAYFNRGQLNSMRGDKNRALADYVQARQLDKQFPQPPMDLYEDYQIDLPNGGFRSDRR